jgi:DnaK suppressor protein
VVKKVVKKAVRAVRTKAPVRRRPEELAGSRDDSGVPETETTIERPVCTYLTPDQIAHFRTLLLEKLKEITGDVDHLESGSLKSSRGDAAGDLSSMPIHMADIGSDNYEQEFSLGLMNSERKIVREILAALKRIDNGTYGICEGTGEPIPLARLNGIPWTRYCMRYAEMLEKGQATAPSRVDVYTGDADRHAEDSDHEESYHKSDEEEERED